MSTPLLVLNDMASTASSWQIGPFTRQGSPLLSAHPNLVFDCPVSGQRVHWASKDVFNPGAIVHEGKVHLLARAEDKVGRYAGVSRIGLATSNDGINFTMEPEPVIFPDDDEWQAWEWPGGCEDPRVVESPECGYVCLYTAFNGTHGSLFVASSPDLRTWKKHGPAFKGSSHAKRWSKSGSIVTEIRDGRLIAARVEGQYWMYWGEGVCYAATSKDLIHWKPVEFDGSPDRFLQLKSNTGCGSWEAHDIPGHTALRPLLLQRPGRFDSGLVEPGPPAVRTRDGIVLIYNGANSSLCGDLSLPADSYQPGQVLFDNCEPGACIARDTRPFMSPEGAVEKAGQYNNVCFAQGLVIFQNRWILYYGMADSRIGCATAPFTKEVA